MPFIAPPDPSRFEAENPDASKWLDGLVTPFSERKSGMVEGVGALNIYGQMPVPVAPGPRGRTETTIIEKPLVKDDGDPNLPDGNGDLTEVGFRENLNSATKSVLPANLRTYLYALAGGKGEINEGHFKEEDLQAMRDAVKRSTARYNQELTDYMNLPLGERTDNKPRTLEETIAHMDSGGGSTPPPKPGIQYGDWYPDDAHLSKSMASFRPTAKDLAVESFRNPGFVGSTTLGRANFEKNDKGETVITDKYDFNRHEFKLDNIINKSSVAEAIKASYDNQGLFGVLETIGKLVGPTEDKPSEGIPVRINLGKID